MKTNYKKKNKTQKEKNMEPQTLISKLNIRKENLHLIKKVKKKNEKKIQYKK